MSVSLFQNLTVLYLALAVSFSRIARALTVFVCAVFRVLDYIIMTNVLCQ